jgi:hypothetical protein
MALYSVNTGSFVYHMTGNHGHMAKNSITNFFPLSASCQRIQSTACSTTMKNSFADRCLSLGARDWYAGASGWTFKGVYAYTGEFFFKAFRDCGDSGTYRTENHRRRFLSLYLSWPAVQFYRLFRRGNGHYRPGHICDERAVELPLIRPKRLPGEF